MKRPLPKTPAQWLKEIKLAIAYAAEAEPFGPLVGTQVTDVNLFHLAPLVCLKYRGRKQTGREADRVRKGTLANYTAAAMKSPYNIPYKAFEWKVKATQCGCPVVRYERWDHCWTPTCGRNWRKDDAKSGMLVSGGV